MQAQETFNSLLSLLKSLADLVTAGEQVNKGGFDLVLMRTEKENNYYRPGDAPLLVLFHDFDEEMNTINTFFFSALQNFPLF